MAKATGRDPRTVRNYLENMRTLTDHATGEILALVELAPTAEGEKWRALPVDLVAVSIATGTYGKGSEQKQKHAKERRMHSRSLMVNKKQ